jgi:hypothetical protein
VPVHQLAYQTISTTFVAIDSAPWLYKLLYMYVIISPMADTDTFLLTAISGPPAMRRSPSPQVDGAGVSPPRRSPSPQMDRAFCPPSMRGVREESLEEQQEGVQPAVLVVQEEVDTKTSEEHPPVIFDGEEGEFGEEELELSPLEEYMSKILRCMTICFVAFTGVAVLAMFVLAAESSFVHFCVSFLVLLGAIGVAVVMHRIIRNDDKARGLRQAILHEVAAKAMANEMCACQEEWSEEVARDYKAGEEAPVENKSGPKVTEPTDGYVEMADAPIPTIGDPPDAPTSTREVATTETETPATPTVTSFPPPTTATSAPTSIETPTPKNMTPIKQTKPKSVVFGLVRPFLRMGKWRREAKQSKETPAADYVSMV